jgi:hypothetical protein
MQIGAVRSVNTSFVLRTKKYTTRLPVTTSVPQRAKLAQA